jgi:hypothetical protein
MSDIRFVTKEEEHFSRAQVSTFELHSKLIPLGQLRPTGEPTQTWYEVLGRFCTTSNVADMNATDKILLGRTTNSKQMRCGVLTTKFAKLAPAPEMLSPFDVVMIRADSTSKSQPSSGRRQLTELRLAPPRDSTNMGSLRLGFRSGSTG